MSEAHRADKTQALKQDHMWHGRLPVGHLAIIAGQPDIGKSTLGYLIAAQADVPTLFITSEEHKTTQWKPRIMAAGLDLKKAWHHKEIRFTKHQSDLEYFQEICLTNEIELVMVDPIASHLDAHQSHNVAVRKVLDPYLDFCEKQRITLVFQVHVLDTLNPKDNPRKAIPAGLRSAPKAIYLFGRHPDWAAADGIRLLAPVKYNFGPHPPAMEFELETDMVRVKDPVTGKAARVEIVRHHFRGEVLIPATALMARLSPETKERKNDRVSRELFDLLKDGPRTIGSLRSYFTGPEYQPPTDWRTVQRVAKLMEMQLIDDPKDKRRKLWALSEEWQAIADEMTEADDELVIEEIDLPDDTFPEDWVGDEDAA